MNAITSFLKAQVASDPRERLQHDIKIHFAEHGEGIVNAARLLGGAGAARAVGAFVADLAMADIWTGVFTSRLRRIVRLFMLEDHIPDSDAALLDPMSPEVGAICWHADRLDEFLQRASTTAPRL